MLQMLHLNLYSDKFQENMIRRTGLQREVLKLYRLFMEACRDKPHKTKEIVQQTFRANASTLERTNIQAIEYLIRRGRNQLRTLKNSDGITKWQ